MSEAESDVWTLDKRSWNLGAIAAFSEMVEYGVKKLALGAPLPPAEMDALFDDAVDVAESHGVGIYLESDFLVTDLFSASLTEGKDVLLVEDIVDTGLTLTKIVEILRERGPESIKTCVLIDKLERRDVDVVIDYRGFQVNEGFLVGYGLDYDEQYRYLPDIYTLK